MNEHKTPTGMCPHGNFPSSCQDCGREQESFVSVKQAFEHYLERFRVGLESKELDEKEREALVLFVDEFAEPAKTLALTQFKALFERHLPRFEIGKDKTAAQKAFVADLVDQLKDMPVGDWDCSIEQTRQTGKNNCSGSAALVTSFAEGTASITGIEVDYVNPYGHALAMVRFEDGSTWYADGRNGVFENVTDIVDYEDRGDFMVYGLREQKLERPFHLLPTTKENWRLIVENYAANMEEVSDVAQGTLSAVLEATLLPQDRERCVGEAQLVLTQAGIRQGDHVRFRKIKNHLEGPSLHAFRKSPEFKKESELWKMITQGMEQLAVIGGIIADNEQMRVHLVSIKFEIKKFLLGQTNHIETGSEQIDQAWGAYRDSCTVAHVLMHKTPEEIVREVDELLSKLT